MNKSYGILLLLLLLSICANIVQYQSGGDYYGEKAKHEAEIKKLNERIIKDQMKIDSLEDVKQYYDTLEQIVIVKADSIKQIDHEKINRIRTASDDSIWQFLSSRYIPR